MCDVKMNLDKRGSIWRKWDLHAHTPIDPEWINKPKLDTEEEKKKFVEDYIKFAKQQELEVIAITDHNFCSDLIFYIEKEAEANNIVILPGFEVTAKDGSGIHLLIIFPEKTGLDKIEGVISQLFAPNQERIKADGTVVCSNKTIDEIKDIINEAKLQSLFIFAHADGDNGILNRTTINGERRMQEWHKDFINICQLSKKPSDFNEGFESNVINAIDQNYKRKMSYIVASDCRTIVETEATQERNYLGQKFVWVKADPSFEGLRQIIYEPKERVSYSQQNPYQDRKKIYFSNVEINGSTNFILPNFDLPLNRELVSIIGGRGSGKSALLETIAFLNEEHLVEDQNKKEKIIEYYRKNLKNSEPEPDFNFKITLTDKDSNESIVEKRLKDYNDYDLPFLYIGQEQLSKIATDDKELTDNICKLIGIDTDHEMKQDMADKSRKVLSDIKIKREAIAQLEDSYKEFGYNGKVPFIDWINTYLENLEKKKTRLSSKETKDILDEVTSNTETLIRLNRLDADLTNLLNQINSINLNKDLKVLNDELTKLEIDQKITDIFFDKQKDEIQKSINKIETKKSVITEKIEKNKEDLNKLGIKEDVNTLIQVTENIQKQISSVSRDLDKHSKLNEELLSNIGNRNKILEKVDEFIISSRDQITEKFVDFINSIDEMSEDNKKLFKRIMGGVGISGKIIFRQNEFINYLLNNCFHNRKIASIEDVKKEIAGEDEKGKSKNIGLKELIDWVKRGGPENNIFVKNGGELASEYIFLKWSDFIKVKAEATLNDKPTDILSIGQRGTLLLKIYLATSSEKQILLIDQPEDNLDNNFIANELVPLLRSVKKVRQIIMATHNANLVVNTDSEQVVIAKIDDAGSGKAYISGGIENSTINENIKEILEGGEEAFKKREQKYNFRK
jgi:ABC-type cobalamin/Fe3+-siderophores transport system ATPase subunit